MGQIQKRIYLDFTLTCGFTLQKLTLYIHSKILLSNYNTTSLAGCWLDVCPHKLSLFLVGFSGMWLENWCWEAEAAVWLMYIRKVEKEIGRNGSNTSAQHSTSTRDHCNIWSWQLTAPVDRGYRTAHLVQFVHAHMHARTRYSKLQGHVITLLFIFLKHPCFTSAMDQNYLNTIYSIAHTIQLKLVNLNDDCK